MGTNKQPHHKDHDTPDTATGAGNYSKLRGSYTLKIKTLMIVLLLIALSTYVHADNPIQMHIRCIEGEAQIKIAGNTEWVLAAINIPLKTGDQIWIPEGGRAEVQLQNGTIFRIDKKTFIEILAAENNLTRFYIGAGHAYIYNMAPGEHVMAVEAPSASLHTYYRSKFRVDVSDNGDTDIAVLQGEIYAERETGQMRIQRGEKYLFKHDSEYPQLMSLNLPDQWDQWNRQRDGEFDLSGSTEAYLPEELKSYSADLASNGRWVNTADYGYVWTPAVAISDTWAPYKVGHWAWSGGDYVWISYETWGWAPYHYGRWAHIKPVGWCWVPPARGSAYWGPGYVGWVHTPTHISWVPLAPGEIYYGRGFHGTHSINTINTNAYRPGNNIYRHVYTKNGVNTIHIDTFVNGRPGRGMPRENLFLSRNRMAGVPSIRPEKTIFSLATKEISQSKIPLEHIRQIRADKVRKDYPVQHRVEKSADFPKISGQKEVGRNMPERIKPEQVRIKAATENKSKGLNEMPSMSNNRVIKELKPIYYPDPAAGHKQAPQSRNTNAMGTLNGPKTTIQGPGKSASAINELPRSKATVYQRDNNYPAPITPASRTGHTLSSPVRGEGKQFPGDNAGVNPLVEKPSTVTKSDQHQAQPKTSGTMQKNPSITYNSRPVPQTPDVSSTTKPSTNPAQSPPTERKTVNHISKPPVQTRTVNTPVVYSRTLQPGQDQRNRPKDLGGTNKPSVNASPIPAPSQINQAERESNQFQNRNLQTGTAQNTHRGTQNNSLRQQGGGIHR